MLKEHLPSKICSTCGRRFTWRRRWRSQWDAVRYCSRRCRERKPSPLDRRLEEAILVLLSERASTATICPSEAARRASPGRWRPLMERTRRAARRLATARRLVLLQRGVEIDPSRVRGPIRLRSLPTKEAS